MTAPAWPPEATCGKCKWWSPCDVTADTSHGICDLADARSERSRMVYVNYEWTDLIVHRDHGCRAWEGKG